MQALAGSHDTFYQYQPSAQDTSSFHGSSWYPCGQRTSEYSHSHPQSHVQVSSGSRDHGFQRQPVTQGASWSHGSYLHPHGLGTSARSHHQSGVHGPHNSHGLQSYPPFQDVSGSYDLLRQHRARYGTSEVSHPQVGEQQCQPHYQPSAGARGEANDAEGGSTSAHMSSKAKRKRGSTKDKIKIREPPTPKFPTDRITRLDLEVALFYYERERIAKLNNDPAYLRLSKELHDGKGEPWVQVYKKIRRNRRRPPYKAMTKEEESLAPENWQERDKKLTASLTTKFSEIRKGKLLGSSWTIEDSKSIEELSGRQDISSLDHKYQEILPFVKYCWWTDKKVLSRLDHNPWKMDPIVYIHRLTEALDNLSRNLAPPPPFYSPPHQQ